MRQRRCIGARRLQDINNHSFHTFTVLNDRVCTLHCFALPLTRVKLRFFARICVDQLRTIDDRGKGVAQIVYRHGKNIGLEAVGCTGRLSL